MGGGGAGEAGRPVTVVDSDGSGRSERLFALWNPSVQAGAQEPEPGEGGSADEADGDPDFDGGSAILETVQSSIPLALAWPLGSHLSAQALLLSALVKRGVRTLVGEAAPARRERWRIEPRAGVLQGEKAG